MSSLNKLPDYELLAAELKEAFDRFGCAYRQTIDPNRHLNSQEIHDLLTNEYQTYEKELQTIKERALLLIKKIQQEHDEKTYQDLLLKLEAYANGTTKKS